MNADRRRIALYAVAVFLSSALLLVLEIVAARPIRSWTRVTDRLTTGVLNHSTPLLTDDNAPVEQLISTLFTTGLGQ